MPVPVTLYKRWRLRAGITPADVTSLVTGQVRPHYRRLSAEVCLGLEQLDDQTVLAIQRWTSRVALERAVAGPTYDAWWRAYAPVLARWDAALVFEDEWETEVLLG